MIRRSFVSSVLVVLAATGLMRPALAGETAGGDVVLAVHTAQGNETQPLADYAMDQLQALPVSVIRTETIWTDGVQEFTGVALSDLLTSLDIRDGMLEAVAVNDYLIDIPVSDAVPGGPIIAYLRNGQPMSLRDKGPLWVIYPYDSSADYQREEIFARSIWQLTDIIHYP
jgi:hypothetical protein